LLVLATLLSIWSWVLFSAHYFWGSESYYNFGWFVPFLAAFLGYRRLSQFSFSIRQPATGPTVAGFIWVAVAAAFLYAAMRLFNEANPFWRVPLWGQAVAAMIASTAFFLLVSGLRGLRHFAFCLLILLMALPWPWRIEQSIIHSLTGMVTEITVLVLNFLAYPAVATGNVIQIGDIRLGVDEACSGIRSLQALVLIALFVGEFFFFRAFYRCLLIAWALLLVMVFNGLRALALALVFLGDNPDRFQFWHDFLGNFNFIGSCVLLFAMGELLNRLPKSPCPPAARLPWNAYPRKTNWRILLSCLTAFFVAEAAVQSYYFVRESSHDPLPELVVDWERAQVRSIVRNPVPPVVANALQYDFGEQLELHWADGLTALVTYYGYTGENRMATITSFAHSPEICLTGLGGELSGEKPPLAIELNGRPAKVEHYDFVFPRRSGQQSLQVFWLVWQPRDIGVEAGELASLNWPAQWAMVMSGRRVAQREVIFIRFNGEHPDEVVRARVRELFSQVTPAPQSP
jgi:exosortase